MKSKMNKLNETMIVNYAFSIGMILCLLLGILGASIYVIYKTLYPKSEYVNVAYKLATISLYLIILTPVLTLMALVMYYSLRRSKLLVIITICALLIFIIILCIRFL